MPAILILIYIFIEVMATSEFSAVFGGGMLFLEILTTGIIGIVMLSSTGNHMSEALMRLRAGDINPQDLMSSAISRVAGGILLFLPGIMSDILGIILQLNQRRFKKRDDENPRENIKDFRENRDSDDIIDVEVVDKEIK